MAVGPWLLRSRLGSFILIFMIIPACLGVLGIVLAFIMPWIEIAFAFSIISYFFYGVVRITIGPMLGWPLPPPRSPMVSPEVRMTHYEVHEDASGRFRILPVFPRR